MDCHDLLSQVSQWRIGREKPFIVILVNFVILSLWRSIHKFKACLKILWIFRYALQGANRNKKFQTFVIRTLSFWVSETSEKSTPLLSFWAFARKRKIHKNLKYTLNLWILHFATQSSVWQGFCHLERSKKSINSVVRSPCSVWILHFLATAQNSKFKILFEFLHKIGVNLGQIHATLRFDNVGLKPNQALSFISTR